MQQDKLLIHYISDIICLTITKRQTICFPNIRSADEGITKICTRCPKRPAATNVWSTTRKAARPRRRTRPTDLRLNNSSNFRRRRSRRKARPDPSFRRRADVRPRSTLISTGRMQNGILILCRWRDVHNKGVYFSLISINIFAWQDSQEINS